MGTDLMGVGGTAAVGAIVVEAADSVLVDLGEASEGNCRRICMKPSLLFEFKKCPTDLNKYLCQ